MSFEKLNLLLKVSAFIKTFNHSIFKVSYELLFSRIVNLTSALKTLVNKTHIIILIIVS